MNLYQAQYSVVRFIPDLIKDEPINIGLILQCSSESYIKCRFSSKKIEMIQKYNSDISMGMVKSVIKDLEANYNSENWVLRNKSCSDFINGQLLIKLSAAHSNQIQFLKPKGVLTESLDDEFDRLFSELIYKEKAINNNKTIEERIMKKRFKDEFAKRNLIKNGLVQENITEIGRFGEKIKIDFGYKNGSRNLVQNLSFDTKSKEPMDYAKLWLANYQGLKTQNNKNCIINVIYYLPENDSESISNRSIVDCLMEGSDELLDYRDDEKVQYFIKIVEETAHK